jgi:uncharacterized protein YdhG (YjbR/CyaY superfamily)
MQSKAMTVDQYMDEIPPERRVALEHLRRLCQTHLVGWTESMGYGMPGYSRDGQDDVGFASQKNHISLYMSQEIAQGVGWPRLKGKRGVSCGKSCIRYSRPEHIDFGVVEEMLKATAALQ